MQRLAVSFFYFHFLYSELTDVHRLAQELLDPSPYYQLFIGHIFFRFLYLFFNVNESDTES